MKRRLPAVLPLAVALAACTPSVYRVDVGAMFVRAEGEIALQNAGGSLILGDEQNDLDDDLGLGGTEASPYLRLEWEHGRHRVRAQGFGFESEGRGALTGDFGGITAGSIVDSELDFVAAGASYSFDVLDADALRLGLGVNLGYYRLDLAVRSGVGQEKVETDLLVPQPHVEAEYYAGPFVLGANFSVMAGDFSDADGRFLDAEGIVRWRPRSEFEVFAGYRHVVLDAFGRASARDFDADLELSGFFVGGGVRF